VWKILILVFHWPTTKIALWLHLSGKTLKKKQQPPQWRQEKQFISNVVPYSSTFVVSHGCLFLYPAFKDCMTGHEVNLVDTWWAFSWCPMVGPQTDLSFFFIGGQLQVQEWMARSKKVWTPSSYWELGPSGNTVIDVSSMGLLLRFLVWFLPSKRSYTSGLLLGLEECHTSSPWVLMLFRSYGYSWSGLTPFYSVCNSF